MTRAAAASRQFAAEVEVSNTRLAKVLGREPSKMTIYEYDETGNIVFGGFEYVDCVTCNGTSRLGQRECPTCQSDLTLKQEMRWSRDQAREAIEIIRATQHNTDWESEWQCEIARGHLANALADLRAMKKAWKVGVR